MMMRDGKIDWTIDARTYGCWKKIFSDLRADGPASPAAGFTPEGWIAYLVDQRIAPYYYFKCSENGNLDKGFLRDGLKRYYIQFMAANEIYKKEAYGILRSINEEGVVPLLLKGIQLQNEVYPHPALRPTSDLDLVVREAADYRIVMRLLERMGYHKYQYRSDKYAECVLKDVAFLPGADRKVMVELHHSLRYGKWDKRRKYDAPFFRSENVHLVDRDGIKYCGLNAEANYLFLCFHLFQSHLNIKNILWVNDLRMLKGGLAGSVEKLELLSEQTMTSHLKGFSALVMSEIEKVEPSTPPFVDDTSSTDNIATSEIMTEFSNMDGLFKKVAWSVWWIWPDYSYLRKKYGRSRGVVYIYYKHVSGIIKGLIRMRDLNE